MTESILLLNANYEPLRAIPLKRAISLLCKDCVDIIDTVPDKMLRSVSTSQPFPSIIRLKYFVRVPRRHMTWSRRAVFARDNYECQYCGLRLSRENATIDHVIPKEECDRRHIRASTWGNCVCSCQRCNLRKANRSMTDAGMRFFHADYEPKTPRTGYLVISGEIPISWKIYLER